MRRDLDWSQQQAFEALRAGLHLGPKSRASYIAIDMGKRHPTLKEQDFLVSFFGKTPDDFPDDPGDAEPVASIAGLTTAITSLVTDLREILDVATRRGSDAEQEDWDAEQGRDRRAGAERRGGPGRPPA